MNFLKRSYTLNMGYNFNETSRVKLMRKVFPYKWRGEIVNIYELLRKIEDPITLVDVLTNTNENSKSLIIYLIKNLQKIVDREYSVVLSDIGK